MSRLRRVAEASFILLMAAGAILALYAFNDAIEDYLDAVALYGALGWDARGWHVLPVGGTAILEFAMTVAFAMVYLRRGSNLLAPLVYAWSYALLGAVFAGLLTAVGRSGTTAVWIWLGPASAALALVIAAPGLVWNWRKSTRS